MKVPTLGLILTCACLSVQAAELGLGKSDLAGEWVGMVELSDDMFLEFNARFESGDDGWSGSMELASEGPGHWFPLSSLSLHENALQFSVQLAQLYRFEGTLAAPVITGSFETESSTHPVQLARAGTEAALALRDEIEQARQRALPRPLEKTTRGPAFTRVEGEALEALVAEATATRSHALVILHEGELVGAWYAGGMEQPIETMSVTKAIVGLAVARMLTTGDLASLDTPVAEFFPEWKQGRKQDVTVRHLMSHTSGLQNVGPALVEIYPSPDFVKLALAAELDAAPGTQLSYNNKAVNLIAGLFSAITGRDMAEYTAEEIFAPLGISEWHWVRDSAGNPHGMAGLQLRPSDLARLGQLVLDGGRYDGEIILDSETVAELIRPGSEFSGSMGLLWQLVPEHTHWLVDGESLGRLYDAAVDAEVMQALEGARGRYEAIEDLHQALIQVWGEGWQEIFQQHIGSLGLSVSRQEFTDKVRAAYHSGHLGQFLVVVPASRLVAVRMIEHFSGIGHEHGFEDFVQQVIKLGDAI